MDPPAAAATPSTSSSSRRWSICGASLDADEGEGHWLHPRKQRELQELYRECKSQGMGQGSSMLRTIVKAHFKGEPADVIDRMVGWVQEGEQRERANAARQRNHERQVHKIFSALDLNRDGRIDELEFSFLGAVVPALSVSEDELASIFRDADADHSGQLDVAEFTRLVHRFDLIKYSAQIVQAQEGRRGPSVDEDPATDPIGGRAKALDGEPYGERGPLFVKRATGLPWAR